MTIEGPDGTQTYQDMKLVQISKVGKSYWFILAEKTAEEKLSLTTTSREAAEVAYLLYESYYGERWLVEMMEQAVLLWMRHTPLANWFDALTEGGPLHVFETEDEYAAAYAEIEQRVKEASDLNALSAQS